MELLVTGFNPFNQLRDWRLVDDNLQHAVEVEEDLVEEHDLLEFTKALEGTRMELPRERFHHTLVRMDGNLYIAGVNPNLKSERDMEFLYSSAENAAGDFLTVEDHGHSLAVWSSLGAWRSRTAQKRWKLDTRCVDIVGLDTAFVVLLKNGEVRTFGDPRFEECLCRTPDRLASADRPGVVKYFRDITDPIRHVAACGYTGAAVSKEGVPWFWGAPYVGSHRPPPIFPDIQGAANYYEIDGGKDVKDVALGDSHGIALTTDGCVYVIGENGNGQLGLGPDFGPRATKWTEVTLNLTPGRVVIRVGAGKHSSYILTAWQ